MKQLRDLLTYHEEVIEDHLSDFDRRDMAVRQHRRPIKGRTDRPGIFQKLNSALRAQSFTAFEQKPERVVVEEHLTGGSVQRYGTFQSLALQLKMLVDSGSLSGISANQLPPGVIRITNAEDLRRPVLDEDGAIILPEKGNDVEELTGILNGPDLGQPGRPGPRSGQKRDGASHKKNGNPQTGKVAGDDRMQASGEQEVPAYISGRSKKYINRTKRIAAEQRRRR